MSGYGMGLDVRSQKPHLVDCDWCEEKAVKAIPLRKRPAQFMYACRLHLDTARRANETKERK